jgi:hypothetical protein
MKQRRHELKILGDWTLNYIWDNRSELLLSKKYDAYQIMDIVIREFYNFAGVEMPEWLTRWITETALEELDVDEAAFIRSILFDHIHDKLSNTNPFLGNIVAILILPVLFSSTVYRT